MILVLAGTQDGREIATALAGGKMPVIASVVSEYGKTLLEGENLTVNSRPLKQDALRQFMIDNSVTAVVDASHPYAASISQTAVRLCAELKVRYFRYERQRVKQQDANIGTAGDYQGAICAIAALPSVKNVFLTTGSRNLSVFTTNPALAKMNLIARVLPEPSVIAECRALGLMPSQIIAMQGPFSHALNVELFKKYRADVIVSKDSGTIGGTDTKLSAARELGIPVVLIDRPTVDYDPQTVYDDRAILLRDIEKYYQEVQR